MSRTLSPRVLDAAVELIGTAGEMGEIPVRGFSMTPLLLPRNLLLVEFMPPVASVRPGDILVFRQVDYLVVHRYLCRARVGAGQVCLRTRGDAVLSLDPPVTSDRVLGRVVAIDRGDGWRDLRTRRARLYARALAVHDLAWAAAGAAAARLDRRPRGGRWRRVVGRLDRRMLRLVHGLLFERMHPHGLVGSAKSH